MAGQAVTPSSGAEVQYASQPVTLSVANGVATGSTPLTYTFEVATDSAFTTKVYTKDAVPQGAGSQTSLVIDKLPGSKTYYWRARVTSGDTVGPNSATRTFTVGAEVVLQPPILLSPAQNGSVTGSAALTITNSQRTGPAGPINYRFDVSTSSSFNPVAYTVTVSEQSGGQTSTTIPANTIASGATAFWRVQATDTKNAITTAFSAASSFQFVAFDMRAAAIWDSPSDLGSWPETSQITSITFANGAFLVDFDRRDGPNRWPDADFGDGLGGTIQYTLGMCLNINGRWNCSTVVQFWYGRDLDQSGPPQDVGINWFYAPRWGTLQGHQPQDGEMVGIFAAAGNLRGRTDPSTAICPRICERTNVQMIPWGTNYNR